MRKFSKSVSVILAGSVALSWYSFVKADDGSCGFEEAQVIVQPELTTYRIIPGEYKWVDGKISGYSLEYRVVEPTFKKVERLFEIVPAMTEEIFRGRITKIPRISKPYEKNELVSEAFPVAMFKAYQHQDGRTRIQTKRPSFEAVTVPAQTITLTRKKPCQLVSSSKAGA